MTENTIKIKKNTLAYVLIGILAIALIVSLFTNGFNFKPTGEAAIKNTENPTTPSIDMKSLIENDAIKGYPDAPITIVEFSDYECPFCERFYSQTFNQIESEYIDNGKVKFVYRDFPLNNHPNAQKAAEAAECAGEQGKYYKMHDQLFESGVTGGVTAFKEYAKTIGLDQEEFNSCLDSGAMASEVKKDMADGQKLGVRGTPAFFINGELISGAQPYSVFKSKIDSLL